MRASDTAAASDPQAIGLARLLTGLLQGLILYLLWQVAEDGIWLATVPPLFAAVALAVAYAPLIYLVGLGQLRFRTLLLWVVIATLVLGGLGAHDIDRAVEDSGAPWPALALWVFAAAGLFVAHHLIAAGDVEGRVIAPIRAISRSPGSTAYSSHCPPPSSACSGWCSCSGQPCSRPSASIRCGT